VLKWAQPRGLLDVVLTPLLYPEDEAEMRRHVDTLQVGTRALFQSLRIMPLGVD